MNIRRTSNCEGSLRFQYLVFSFCKRLFSEITVIPRFAISKENYKKALSICDEIDPKDTAYLALSIELNLPLWTNDKN